VGYGSSSGLIHYPHGALLFLCHTNNKLQYWVAYDLRREYNDVYYSYDVEPDSHVKTHLSITDYAVFDEEGQSVTSDFDPSVIEEIINED
jgi:hypothetical protein